MSSTSPARMTNAEKKIREASKDPHYIDKSSCVS